jgi:hypothetical protein
MTRIGEWKDNWQKVFVLSDGFLTDQNFHGHQPLADRFPDAICPT